MVDERTDVLIERFRGGDGRAYEALFRRYHGPLLRFIRLHADPALRSRVPADDLAQEVHAAALRGLDGFTYTRESSFFFWLCGIARNQIRMAYRTRARRPPAARAEPCGLSSLDLMARVRDRGPSPLDRVAADEGLHLLASALLTLSARQQEAIVLRFFEQASGAESAARMGLTPGSFRVTLSRALVALRAALAELLGESGG